MAANLDRAETSLTAVSDIAYIRGIDGSGNSVRISKADLASVLGAFGNITSVEKQNINLNTLNTAGVSFHNIKILDVTTWQTYNFPNNSLSLMLFCFFRNTSVGFQFAYTSSDRSFWFRAKWAADDVWKDWEKIAFVS